MIRVVFELSFEFTRSIRNNTGQMTIMKNYQPGLL